MKLFRLTGFFLCCVVLPLVSACEDNRDITPPTPETTVELAVLNSPDLSAPLPDSPPSQFKIDNKNYLFDISRHSQEELESLLQRAEEIFALHMDSYPDLEIVMVLHGPDIDWFQRGNYENNRQLVDLAEKLDANEIIDMKVCEKTLDEHGLKREDIPEFIESVPYAPDEIKRLQDRNYINL